MRLHKLKGIASFLGSKRSRSNTQADSILTQGKLIKSEASWNQPYFLHCLFIKCVLSSWQYTDKGVEEHNRRIKVKPPIVQQIHFKMCLVSTFWYTHIQMKYRSQNSRSLLYQFNGFCWDVIWILPTLHLIALSINSTDLLDNLKSSSFLWYQSFDCIYLYMQYFSGNQPLTMQWYIISPFHSHPLVS